MLFVKYLTQNAQILVKHIKNITPVITLKNFPPTYSEISTISLLGKFLKSLYIITAIARARALI